MVHSKKEELAFSVPDALLGIFCRYFGPTETENLAVLRFERLRDKYRHIANRDTGEFFYRRHPIER